MKKIISMLLVILIFSLSFVLSGCENEIDVDSTWTIFIYMCGSNLETKNSAATKNMLEMVSKELPDGVNIIIEAGGSKTWHTDGIENDVINRLFVNNGKISKISTIEQANMGKSETLEDFLTWGISNYPSDKYGLVFWDHGNGCLGGVCNDENYFFDSLELPEIDNALNTISNKMDKKFEFIGCDACLMANFSTAGLFSKYANYMYGSEEIEPSGGWNYVSLLESVINDNEIGGKELGINLCEGYYAKSLVSKRSAIATMACFDLSLFDELNESFNKLSKELIKKSKSVEGLRDIAYAAKNAVKFGGSTDNEGYSNLIDLGSFIDGINNLNGKEEFLDKLDEFVIYHKAGEQKISTKGLSIFYPMDVDTFKADKYKEVCPANNYADFLTYTFSNIPDETIEFANSGNILEGNEFSVVLENKSLNYVLSVDFNLVEYDLDDSSDSIVEISLGTDNDMFSEKTSDGMRFYSNFRGVWNSLNGYKLYNNVVESTEEHIIFDAPIRVNNSETNLRYAFIFDDSYTNGGYYKILGAWDGIDLETGMSDKDLRELTKDDTIEVYYPYKIIELSNNGKVSSSAILDKYVMIPKSEDFKITEDGLDGESYIYQVIITDLYGRKYYSNAGFFAMNKSREQINSSSKLNGKYAGYAKEIIRTDFKSVFDSEFIDSQVKFENFRNLIQTYRLNNKDNIGKSNIIKF